MPIPPPQKVDVQIHKFLKLDSEAYIVSQKPLEATSKCLDFKSFPVMGMYDVKDLPTFHLHIRHSTAPCAYLLLYYSTADCRSLATRELLLKTTIQLSLMIPPFLQSCPHCGHSYRKPCLK